MSYDLEAPKNCGATVEVSMQHGQVTESLLCVFSLVEVEHFPVIERIMGL